MIMYNLKIYTIMIMYNLTIYCDTFKSISRELCLRLLVHSMEHVNFGECVLVGISYRYIESAINN